jgi:hypothetical protein
MDSAEVRSDLYAAFRYLLEVLERGDGGELSEPDGDSGVLTLDQSPCLGVESGVHTGWDAVEFGFIANGYCGNLTPPRS